MNQEEKNKLKQALEHMDDNELIEALCADKKEFDEEAYDLYRQEAKSRGLEDKIKKAREPQRELKAEANEKMKLVNVYQARTVIEADLIKILFDQANIECTYSEFPLSAIRSVGFITPDSLSSVQMFVRENQAQEAKEIIKEYLKHKDEQ
ncbi:MAG: hypothetical protein ABH865_06595 [Candidatus Omnitrophota bacterium]